MALGIARLIQIHQETCERLGAAFAAEAEGAVLAHGTIERLNELADDLDTAIRGRELAGTVNE